MAGSLLQYLDSTRLAASSDSLSKVTAVIGNTSCDLDSFVSAVVLSYFYNHCRDTRTKTSESTFIPLLNLPSTPSSELWRLRPEFGTALRLASRPDIEPCSTEEQNEISKELLSSLVTIKDLSETPYSNHLSAFKDANHPLDPLPCILVDHNAPSISGFSTKELRKRLKLTGCIDHHVDESAVPPDTRPRIIKTGIGSCTSLIVQHLRNEGFWTAAPSGSRSTFFQISKLALAPVLIDTFNLRATGDKCSDTDRQSVTFLESHITNPASQASTTSQSQRWNRDAFFETIHSAKQSALDLLTMPEILEHDYKEWTETNRSTGQVVTIGIPSLVKPLSWLIKKSGSATRFLDEILSFAYSKDLQIVALLTKSTGPDGEFRKEIAVLSIPQKDNPKSRSTEDNDILRYAVHDFERQMISELNLQEWREDNNFMEELRGRVTDHSGAYSVSWQDDTEKSRKQIAPALRDAVRNAKT